MVYGPSTRVPKKKYSAAGEGVAPAVQTYSTSSTTANLSLGEVLRTFTFVGAIGCDGEAVTQTAPPSGSVEGTWIVPVRS